MNHHRPRKREPVNSPSTAAIASWRDQRQSALADGPLLPDPETSCIHIIVAWSTAVSSTWFGKARQNHRGMVHSRPSDSIRCPQRKKRADGQCKGMIQTFTHYAKRTHNARMHARVYVCMDTPIRTYVRTCICTHVRTCMNVRMTSIGRAPPSGSGRNGGPADGVQREDRREPRVCARGHSSRRSSTACSSSSTSRCSGTPGCSGQTLGHIDTGISTAFLGARFVRRG